MKKRYILLVILLLAFGYLLFYPVPINPGTWTPPKAPSFEEGDFKSNTKLTAIQHLFDGQCVKPEDIALDSLGRIYTGYEDGRIMRFDGMNDDEGTEIANTGGRPLGLRFDSTGYLYVADCSKGLLKVSMDGEITTLTDSYNGQKFKFADDLDVAADGTVYFSEASTRFGIEDFILDFMEHQPNGMLMAYNPADKSTTIALDKLYFANGVALSPDESYVLVNESAKYRIKKLWLKGEKKGQSEIFMENLPGVPDGIIYGDGLFWIVFASPRQQDVDDLLSQPFMRKVVVRLPPSLLPAPVHYSFAIAVNEEGEVIHNLQDPNGSYAEITNVLPVGDKLYFGSLYEDAIGVMDKPK